MRDRAAAFERAWTEAGSTGAFSSAREIEPIVSELLLAESLRTMGTSIAEPDWEASWDELVDELAADLAAPPHMVREPRRRVRSRMTRVAAAALAAVVVVGGASIGAAGASPSSLLYPVRRALERGALLVSVRDAGIHLRIAWAREADLTSVLRDGRFDLAPQLAEDLVAARAVAAESGAEVGPLDLAIVRDVAPALAGAPPDVRRAVREILGRLIPGDESIAILPGPVSPPNRAPDRIPSGLLLPVPADEAGRGGDSDDLASRSDQRDQDGSGAEVDQDDAQGEDQGSGSQDGDQGDDQGGGDDQDDSEGDDQGGSENEG